MNLKDVICSTEYSKYFLFRVPTSQPTPEPTDESCPANYHQVGTLSTNNDIGGSGLGQSYDATDISGCEAKCANNAQCVAFMWESNMKLCELADTTVPNADWGSNFRFCALDDSNFFFFQGLIHVKQNKRKSKTCGAMLFYFVAINNIKFNIIKNFV